MTCPNLTCSFCHGRPVLNAARWRDPSARVHAACPRCGCRAPEPQPDSIRQPHPEADHTAIDPAEHTTSTEEACW